MQCGLQASFLSLPLWACAECRLITGVHACIETCVPAQDKRVTSFLSLRGEEADSLPARAARLAGAAARQIRRLVAPARQAPTLAKPAPAGPAPKLALQSSRWATPRPRGWLPPVWSAAGAVAAAAEELRLLRALAVLGGGALLVWAAVLLAARARTDAQSAMLHAARGGCVSWALESLPRPV